MASKSVKFSPVIPLLFGAFILTAYVAVKNQNTMVLGEASEQQIEERKEIRDVKVEKTEAREIRNKMKIKIEKDLRLKIKEATPEAGKNEISERLIKIKSQENEMEIEDETESEDKKVRVRTNFPITVNQTENTISVTTPNGEVKVKELPSTAIDNMVENGLFKNVTDATIEESSDGETPAVLNVKGENEYKFLGLFKVKGKVEAEVDQETGEVSSLKTPWFISRFGFLFSK